MAEELSVTREGDTLVIRIPIQAPTPSASGKTLVVASTRGNQRTALQIDGKDLYLGLNAYVYAKPRPLIRSGCEAVARRARRLNQHHRQTSPRRRTASSARTAPRPRCSRTATRIRGAALASTSAPYSSR